MHEFRCALRTMATEHRVLLAVIISLIQIRNCNEPNFTLKHSWIWCCLMLIVEQIARGYDNKHLLGVGIERNLLFFIKIVHSIGF